MKIPKSDVFYRWLAFLGGLAVVIVLLLTTNLVDSTAQISVMPTATFTPYSPTDTPLPPTDTPPPPTDTPVPPTLPALGTIELVPSDGIVAAGSSLLLTAVFTDPPPPPYFDELVAMWAWGDGTSTTCPGDSALCTIDPGDGTFRTMTASHVYQQTGVYPVQITVIDSLGQSDSATYEFVVVYDPDAGSVSGGGWIYSGPGAYIPDPGAEGTATFGFVSRYQKGAVRPDGNTQFQFHAADLTFHSSSYDWLVVTGGDHAMFKGAGTINGAGDYWFMLWAGDGDPDTFRIKIWWEHDQGVEHVVYDNGFGQGIGGGQIVIRTK